MHDTSSPTRRVKRGLFLLVLCFKALWPFKIIWENWGGNIKAPGDRLLYAHSAMGRPGAYTAPCGHVGEMVVINEYYF